jgi:hypothetical protein
MFGTVFLTVLLLIGIPVGFIVSGVGLTVAGARSTGWTGVILGFAMIIAYLMLWCYGAATAVSWWIQIANA